MVVAGKSPYRLGAMQLSFYYWHYNYANGNLLLLILAYQLFLLQ